MIAYINSLPAELQKIFAQCLAEATASLKQALSAQASLVDVSASLTAAQAAAQAVIDSNSETASGNTTTVTAQSS